MIGKRSSVHESGELIEWDACLDPGDVRSDLLDNAVRELAAATLLVRHWAADGGRHNTQLTVTGFLVRGGWSVVQTARFVAAVSAAAGAVGDYEKRLQTAKDAAARLETDKPLRGFPALVDALGEKIAKAVATWLDLSTATPSSPRAATITRDLALGSDVELARKILQELRESLDEVIFADGAFYHWTGDHWKTLQEGKLRLSVHQFDGAAYSVGEDKISYIRLNKSRVDSILSEMRPMAEVDDFFANPPTGINCRSGFIRFDDNNLPLLEPHDPEHRQRHALSGRWARDFSLLQ